MDDLKEQYKRLFAVFDGDGAELRQQFIYAGLLLTIFERLKEYVVGQLDGYFATHIRIKNGAFNYSRGKEFKKLIKEKGAGQPGQHSNKDFRAAIYWFHDCDAIDKDELDEVERLYNLRNEIGHELLQVITDDRKSPISLFDIVFVFGLYVKIVRWWVMEIEATTDPDMNAATRDATDWDNAESVDTMLLREIMMKTLADDPQWQDALRMTKDFQNKS